MPVPASYDYAVIRVVPRVEREEFVNVGVVLSCPLKDFLGARIHMDGAKLRALDPGLDVDLIERHLATIAVICRGGESRVPSVRFHRDNAFTGSSRPVRR